MFDFTSLARDWQERPLLYPAFAVYNAFMGIRRYEHMPFYIYPSGQRVVSFEDGVLKFVDHLVDAHEIERNKNDAQKTFYSRAIYVKDNFHRYSNDTMANLMFDTQLRKSEYDRLNTAFDWNTKLFYASATATHILTMAYASYFFRYRTLNKL
jgi:hypothetical protein